MSYGMPPPSVPSGWNGPPDKPSRWAAGARAIRNAVSGLNMGDMEGLQAGMRGKPTAQQAAQEQAQYGQWEQQKKTWDRQQKPGAPTPSAKDEVDDPGEAPRTQYSTISMKRALTGLNPALGEAYVGAKWAFRGNRTLADHLYSRERQATVYGGQDPRNIQTNRIRMAHTGNLSENEREDAQRRNVLNIEGEMPGGGVMGLPTVPNMSPPGGSFYDFGDGPTAPNMPSSSSPQDMLHRNMSGTLWGDTHTQAMGNLWGDPHKRATAGIGLPGPDPFPGIRAPRTV